jgi:excisionase family DNA binding protein
MAKLAGAETLRDFTRRAREHMATGDALVTTIGEVELVLAPELGAAVVDALDVAVGDRPPAPARAAPEATSAGAGDEMSLGQAADLLGVTRATVGHLIDRGDLAATRVGTRRRLSQATVLACRERARSQRSATVAEVIAASRDLDLYR